MDYSAESVRFLHMAYALMALGQLAYVAFLVKRWRSVEQQNEHTEDRDA